MRRGSSVLISSWLAMSLVAPAREALAQATERAAAQTLFDQAVSLRDAGQIPAACAKFEESLRLDPGVGTQYNLADCYERQGKTASAWTYFLEVAARTSMAGQRERTEAAQARAQRLEPRLSRMVITHDEAAPDTRITRNGVAVGRAQWSTPVPVDPGVYVIAAVAPGKRPWERRVEVAPDATVLEVDIPPLLDGPNPSSGLAGSLTPVAPVAPAPGAGRDRGGAASDGLSSGAIAGITVGAIGVVGLGVGAAFGIVAVDGKNEVDSLCPDDRCPSMDAEARAASANDDARTAGNVATGALIGGGVLAATGLILWLVLPDDDHDATAWTLRPWTTGPTDAGLFVYGSF
ncbi:MAG: hypothetical protein AAF715_04560 [Myxococcota bacterium]